MLEMFIASLYRFWAWSVYGTSHESLSERDLLQYELKRHHEVQLREDSKRRRLIRWELYVIDTRNARLQQLAS